MYLINKGLKLALFAAVTAISFLSSSNLSAEDGVIATFQTKPILANRHRDSSWNREVADRHSDVRSSWNQNRQAARQPDQGYYYWNEKYFVGRPNFYDRPYSYYYYDPKYFYDSGDNGSIRYYPNQRRQ